MGNLSPLMLIAIIVSLIGSAILVVGFIPQTKKIYKFKHTYGISKPSWIQNYIGRMMFSLYLAFVDDGSSSCTWVLPMMIGQLAVGFMSVPVLYYIFRNKRSEGEYKKEHFNNKLFATRIVLTMIMLTAATIFILSTGMVNVIHLPHGDSIKYFQLVYGLIASCVVSTAFIPQSFKTIKTRNTKSTSLMLTILFSIGNTMIMLAFLLKLVDKAMNGGDAVAILGLVGPIIFINMGTVAMVTIVIIKLTNMKKHGEKA